MKNDFDSVSRSAVSPSDCVRAMQADTKGGILRIRFPLDDEEEAYDSYYICRMNRTAEDNLQEKKASVQADPHLSAVWDIHLRPLAPNAFDAYCTEMEEFEPEEMETSRFCPSKK